MCTFIHYSIQKKGELFHILIFLLNLKSCAPATNGLVMLAVLRVLSDHEVEVVAEAGSHVTLALMTGALRCTV